LREADLTVDFDVVVVGSGLAGMAAAIASANAGASVVVLEAQPKLGGATRQSTGILLGAGTRFQRERGFVDTAGSLLRDLLHMNQWRGCSALMRTLALGAGPSVEWLAGIGVGIDDLTFSGEEETPRAHVTAGGNVIYDAVEAHGRALGVEIIARARVERLVLRNGCVCGVMVNGEAVSAGAVILACGGYGANANLIARFHGGEESSTQIGYVGPEGATGDIFDLAGTAGADMIFGPGSRAPTCAFGSSYLPSFAVIVNQAGRRFIDESMSYGVAEALFHRQPGKRGYLIFDEAVKCSLTSMKVTARYFKTLVPHLDPAVRNWRSHAIDELVAQGAVFAERSLDDLARRWGIPPDSLHTTIEMYNRYAELSEDRDFFKSHLGLRPITTPPFYSTDVTLGKFGLTGSGVRTDASLAVQRPDETRVPGLFAAGECVGRITGDIYYGSGASLSAAIVSGFAAGASASAGRSSTPLRCP
jgi:fumarate reductase flavoprotein subunit